MHHPLTSRLATNCLSRVANNAFWYEPPNEGIPETIEGRNTNSLHKFCTYMYTSYAIEVLLNNVH